MDLLVAYGMTNLQHFVIQHCPNLNQIYLSDYTKLPSTLYDFNLSFNNITAISSNIQYWLLESNYYTVEIQNNMNFWCNPSIEWIANFYLCQPLQIVGTIWCAQTFEPLQDYLSSFKYNCK